MKRKTFTLVLVFAFFFAGNLLSQVNVTLRVDMTDAAGFDPSTDKVYISGYPAWNQPGANPDLEMTLIADNIYTITFSDVEAGNIEFKFYKNSGWYGGEWDGHPNRTLTIGSQSLIATHDWGNIDSQKIEYVSGAQVVLLPGNWSNATGIATYRWNDPNNPTIHVGWIFGNNHLGHYGAGQKFEITDSYTIIGAYYWLGAADTEGDGDVNFNIYTINEDETIGDIIASVIIPLSDVEVLSAETGDGNTVDSYQDAFYVEFDEPVEVTSNFLMGVTTTGVVWATHGDGIGMASSHAGQGGGLNLAYIKTEGGWLRAIDHHSFLNLDVAIFPVIVDGSVPTLSVTPALLTDFETTEGTASDAQTFEFSGSNLTADAVVTAPADFEVSKDGGTTYDASVTVEHSEGSITDQEIHVRIAASAGAGTPSGNVTVASEGAGTKNVAVSGEVNAAGTTPTFTNGQDADFVVGQEDFTTGTPGHANQKMNNPFNIAIDAINGKMYVADYSNNRVLRFAYPITSNFPEAELVFGQSDFTSGGHGTGANKLRSPSDVAVDADGNLWVADHLNNRVLKFNVAHSTAENGPNADVVIGQPDFETVSQGSTLDKMKPPSFINFDEAENLWVSDYANHRVLRFNSGNQSTGATANGFLGTGSSGSAMNQFRDPMGLVCIGTTLYVTDGSNHRILRFDNAATKENSADADAMLGTGIQGTSQNQLKLPHGLTKDASGNLYVADLDNHRVLIYHDALQKADQANADVVLGQPDFTSASFACTQSEMRTPTGLAYDDDNNVLLVAELLNNRVLVFGAADVVLYQITFDASDGEGGEVQTVPEGVVPTPPVVTRAGHTFMGWTPEIVEATADATYTAQWEEDSNCFAGEFWTARTAAAANTWNSVTYGNDLFVAVALNGTNLVMTSTDGIVWTARSEAENQQWTSVTYGNGLFVAVASTLGGVNLVMTSEDGINWTIRTATEANPWRSVTYGNGLFVAVASYSESGNYVMTSPDGITWTPRTAAESNSWRSVTYGNGLFVAVAQSGTNRVMTSPDGIDWTARSAAASEWQSVTYGNGLFVAVAGNGTDRVITSPDGINWTARTAAEQNEWRSVTYGNGLFVAVAVNGTNRVMTSPDGIDWTARAAADNNSWSSVTYGAGMFVAVSWNGSNRVMTSECAAPALTVTTQAASSITTSTATGHGNITAIGSGNATNRGVIYYPYTNNDKEIGCDDVTNVSETGDFGTGAFTASLTGLAVNTRYNARAHATNADDGLKYGSRVDFWTLANVPSAPTVNGATETTLNVTVNVNGNPTNTEFAIHVTATGVDQFVQAAGTLGAGEVWQTADDWGTTTLTGLNTGETYSFKVKARNGDHIETAFGESASGITCANPTEGGTIAASQNICSGTAPAAFTSELLPSGHGGTLEYQWQISTASPTFVDIPGATSETYTHTEPLSQTTWFRRMVRVTCDPVGWASATASNSVQVTVEPMPFSGSLEKHPNDDSVAMGATVSATLTEEGSGGNGTDELQYRTHDGTSWSEWENYTSGNEISSFLKTEIQVRTWREADYCPPAGIVTVSWDVEQTSVVNVNEGFVYYFIQHAIDAASEGDTIRIGTNIYPENINTTGKGGLTLQPGFSQGIVTGTGTFTLSAGDVLEMELFGDNDYDKLIIEDDAQINGAELKIIVASGYKPEAGKRFIIFTSPNNPGTFSNPQLISANGHHFILSYENNAKNGGYSVVLTAVKQMFKMEIRQVGSQ